MLYSKFQFLSDIPHINSFIVIIVGIIILFYGVKLLFKATLPIVFDKTKGAFWKGREELDHTYNRNIPDKYVNLDRVHALQIVTDFNEMHNYYSYQLNLILFNGKRVMIVNHGNQYALQLDAQKLAYFLKKPLWDASEYYNYPPSIY